MVSVPQVWQAVFKAMLGETDYFDQLSGTDYDTVATLLLVVFILVITIMMLNLLVAVLSTAHARVDNDADMEFKASEFWHRFRRSWKVDEARRETTATFFLAVEL